MAPRPIASRLAEPLDFTSLETEIQGGQVLPRGETPSPRTPSSVGSPSPPSFNNFPHIPQRRPIVPPPIAPTDDGLPYDHTLPDYIRQVSGQPSLSDVHVMSLRVLTEAASLQQMSFYTPNLRELNLEGSNLISLRDIGCELQYLQVLWVGRCHLTSLDGVMGLSNLKELHASGNTITSAAPCAHLPKLRLLDISRNRILNVQSLGFLSLCRNLRSIYLMGNPVANLQGVDDFIRSALPSIDFLDDSPLRPQDVEDDVSETTNSNGDVSTGRDNSGSSYSSRVSSAGSSGLELAVDPIPNGSVVTECPSTSPQVGSVSKLTSGQILCGNLTSLRRRQSVQLDETPEEVLDKSERWREAYKGLQQVNGSCDDSEATVSHALGSTDDSEHEWEGD